MRYLVFRLTPAVIGVSLFFLLVNVLTWNFGHNLVILLVLVFWGLLMRYVGGGDGRNQG